jgi:long-subunit acyl-CoA synthetase (AMP-forming)
MGTLTAVHPNRLEKLETLYKESSLVENVMIHADTEENVLVAVVQPSKKAGDDEDAFKKEFEAIAKKNNVRSLFRPRPLWRYLL